MQNAIDSCWIHGVATKTGAGVPTMRTLVADSFRNFSASWNASLGGRIDTQVDEISLKVASCIPASLARFFLLLYINWGELS
jgi:hypothetical protein